MDTLARRPTLLPAPRVATVPRASAFDALPGAPAVGHPPRTRAHLSPGGREASVVTTVVALLVVSAVLEREPLAGAELGWRLTVAAAVVALTGNVLLYVHWRLASGGSCGWLILASGTTSLHGLALALLGPAQPGHGDAEPELFLISRVATGLGVLLLGVAPGRLDTLDPLLAGCAMAGALLAAPYGVLLLLPDLHVGGLVLAVLLIELAVAAVAAVLPTAARGVRRRMAAVLAVFALGHAASSLSSVDGGYVDLLGSALLLVGAVLLLLVSTSLVRAALRDHRATVRVLRGQLMQIEQATRAEQARLHEIRATVAGIAHAADLIQHPSLAPARRELIGDMMTSELYRLGRLSARDGDAATGTVDLDRTIAPLVARMVAQGHRVLALRSGQLAHARTDDVAEVVSVLLENAARHARGADVSVTCRRRGDLVEVVVADRGPGVPADLAERIFDWGCSGPGSPGDGIGLHVARRLSRDLGGDLRLLAAGGPGATFVLTLPVAGVAP